MQCSSSGVSYLCIKFFLTMSEVDLTVVVNKQVHIAFSSIYTYYIPIIYVYYVRVHIEIQRHLFKYNIMYFLWIFSVCA